MPQLPEDVRAAAHEKTVVKHRHPYALVQLHRDEVVRRAAASEYSLRQAEGVGAAHDPGAQAEGFLDLGLDIDAPPPRHPDGLVLQTGADVVRDEIAEPQPDQGFLRQALVPDEAADLLQDGGHPGLLVNLAHGQAGLGHPLQGSVQGDQLQAVQAVLHAQGQERTGI